MFKEDRQCPLSGRATTTLVVLFDWLGLLSTNLTATQLLTTVYKKLFVTKLVDVDLMMLQTQMVETLDHLTDLAEHAKHL
jgi:hypothetical protein